MTRFTGMGGHQRATSTTDEWLTPLAVTDALGGAQSFDLDPCSPVVKPWPTARRHYTIVDDGLALPWFGRVFLNPPYKRDVIGRWLERLAEHGRGQALIFARTDTKAFHEHVFERASALLFLRGRLDFLDTDGKPRLNAAGRAQNSGAPSVLCAYGAEDLDVLAYCGLEGKFVMLRLARGFMVSAPTTWRELLVERCRLRGALSLDDLYRELTGHPKTRGNPNWRAKVRQVLQQGPFERVARGTWRGVPA